MTRRAWPVALLLFFSGACALLYQVVWMRALRLVFGASTPATAVVLAVFMGGLGYGSYWLGKRAEKSSAPLALYAKLELGIALSAAVSPVLLWWAQSAYFSLGGVSSLGTVGATLVRLLLSAVVLLPPTLLMGGTLPAAARAATNEDDHGRRATAWLYGANALGAVCGVLGSSFLLLEVFGTRMTLWLGCLINLLVAMVARSIARRRAETRADSATDATTKKEGLAEEPIEDSVAESGPGDGIAPSLALIAAGVVGFVFLLMELVWYRVLSPLLGGSSYTFGLILAFALLGIGLGGLVYASRPKDRPVSLNGFALTCALEGVFLAIPYLMGDNVALLALLTRGLGGLGMSGQLVSWSAVVALVVLPGAMVSGYQFPLLVALLGRARKGLAVHVGRAYAANTLGAIVGSLAGGFILFPLVAAEGAWRLAVVTLAVLALVCAWRAANTWSPARVLPGAIALLTIVSIYTAEGPTAVWRHSPIGAGRVDSLLTGLNRNGLQRWMNGRKRVVKKHLEGRESAIGLSLADDTILLVNGKSDGAAVNDAPTQVMGGLVGALRHPKVEHALVIGLGTGSTAGWIGALPEVKHVDAVEIEPAVLEVVEACRAVNQDVLNNPKVHVHLADAREVLLTTASRYDLVFSEPSNPYRAGVASLFTQEFYAAVKQRLRPGGVFVQWVQGYEIDARSVRIIYATLSSVFGSVESWRTDHNDLALIASDGLQAMDAKAMRARLAQEPFRSALSNAWRTEGLEGALAHYVARPGFAKQVAKDAGPMLINSDDRNLLEFALARAMGREHDFSVEDVRRVAMAQGADRPAGLIMGGDVDWSVVADAYISMGIAVGVSSPSLPELPDASNAQQRRRQAQQAWINRRPRDVVGAWETQNESPTNPVQRMVLADAYAQLGNAENAIPLIDAMRNTYPAESHIIEAKLHLARGNPSLATKSFARAIQSLRQQPWAHYELIKRSLPGVALALSRQSPGSMPEVVKLLAEPLSANVHDDRRRRLRFEIAMRSGDAVLCAEALADLEPHVPWRGSFLEQRVDCYTRNSHPRLGIATAELETFRRDAPEPFVPPAAPLPTQ